MLCGNREIRMGMRSRCQGCSLGMHIVCIMVTTICGLAGLCCDCEVVGRMCGMVMRSDCQRFGGRYTWMGMRICGTERMRYERAVRVVGYCTCYLGSGVTGDFG